MKISRIVAIRICTECLSEYESQYAPVVNTESLAKNLDEEKCAICSDPVLITEVQLRKEVAELAKRIEIFAQRMQRGMGDIWSEELTDFANECRELEELWSQLRSLATGTYIPIDPPQALRKKPKRR